MSIIDTISEQEEIVHEGLDACDALQEALGLLTEVVLGGHPAHWQFFKLIFARRQQERQQMLILFRHRELKVGAEEIQSDHDSCRVLHLLEDSLCVLPWPPVTVGGQVETTEIADHPAVSCSFPDKEGR